jgi:hypothetical protein
VEVAVLERAVDRDDPRTVVLLFAPAEPAEREQEAR